MALATYVDLKASLAAWLDRSDLGTVADDLIDLAEERLNRDLAGHPALSAQDSTLTLSAGVSTLNLPVGCQGVHGLQLLTPVAKVLTPSSVDTMAALASSTGTPDRWAVLGSTSAGLLKAKVHPTPDAACTLAVTYRGSLTPLDGTNTVNALLALSPSLYLYACLCAAEPYLGNDARLATWESRYSYALSSFLALEWDGSPQLMTDVPAVSVAFDITQG